MKSNSRSRISTTNIKTLQKIIQAGLGALGVGAGLLFLLLFPLSGGILFTGPLNWGFGIVGVLLLFGGPIKYSLYLQSDKRSKRLAVVGVLTSGVIAYFLTLVILTLFLRESDFVWDFLLFETLFAALLIVFIQTLMGDVSHKDEWMQFVTGVTLILVLTFLWANKPGGVSTESLEGLWHRVVLIPVFLWTGALVFSTLVKVIIRSR